jgi:hypothetical protein
MSGRIGESNNIQCDETTTFTKATKQGGLQDLFVLFVCFVVHVL